MLSVSAPWTIDYGGAPIPSRAALRAVPFRDLARQRAERRRAPGRTAADVLGAHDHVEDERGVLLEELLAHQDAHDLPGVPARVDRLAVLVRQERLHGLVLRQDADLQTRAQLAL